MEQVPNWCFLVAKCFSDWLRGITAKAPTANEQSYENTTGIEISFLSGYFGYMTRISQTLGWYKNIGKVNL